MTAATASIGRSPTVLIVDDVPNNLGVLVECLESLESAYRLVVAQDGHEGLACAALVKPDLILLDVMMPGMDGFEVCRRLKQNPDTADIPVIFLTTLTETEHNLTGFEVGGVDYLTKPMQIDEVVARVGAHLVIKSMREQLQEQNRQLQRQQAELEQRIAQLSASNRLLREEIAERERVDKTLKFIAQRSWMADGRVFLTELVRYLGQLLGVDYVLVDKLAADPNHAETVALYARGKILPNLQYRLEHTPCANVMASGLCCYTEQVQQQFPNDTLLVDMQVESYIGLPLWDSTGQIIGLIAVMDGKPIADERTVASLLQLVATSAAAELERRRSEQRLEESRQFLSRIIETIPDPVFVEDSQHRWVLINPAFSEFMGYPHQDLLGKSYDDIFPKNEADRFRAQAEAVFDSGVERVDENEVTNRDGKIHTVVTKKIRYLDERGDAYLVGILQDITERKRMEAALVSQANLQQTLLNAVADAGMQLMIVENGSIVHVGNRKLAYEFGYTDAEIDAHPPLIDIVHPDDRARIMDYHQHRLAGEAVPSSYELALVTRDGERRDYETAIAVVPDSDPVRIVTIGKDITGRKAAERRLSHVLSSLPGFIYSFRMAPDGHCSFPFASRGIEDIYGLTADDVKDDMAPLHALAHPDDAPRIMAAIAESMQALTPFRAEVRVLRPGYPERWIECRSLPERDGDDGIIWHGLMLDITERKHAEASLRESEEKLRGLYELAPLGIALTDMIGRFIEFNEAFRVICGYPADELKTLDYWALTPKEYETQEVEQLEALSRIGRYGPYEKEYRQKNGCRIAIRLNGMLIAGQDGQRYIWSIVEDITERQRAEKEKQRLISILEESADFIGSADMQGNLLYHNRAARRMVGLPDDADLSTMHVADMHPEWAAKRVLETGFPSVLECGVWRGDSALRHRDGREIPVAQLLMLHRDIEGRPEFTSTIMQDLTESKRIQNRLELIERAVDLSADTILLIDDQLRFTYVNEATCRSLGYRREELLGMTPPDIDVDVTREMAMAMLQSTFENGSLPAFESRHRHKDGRVFPVEISTSLVEYGGAQFSLALVRDITERKRTEEALKFIAQADWMKSGDEFLPALTRYLSQALAVDYVIVDKLAANPGYAETVAVYAKGDVIPNRRYALKDTPCEQVIAGKLCCYPADVRRQFPKATLLEDLQVDSYAGLPLWDSTGALIGLIAVLDGKPFGDTAAITSILQLVASSVAAELVRRQSEQALTESRQFLGRIIDAIPDPVSVKDRAHRWLHLNQAYCDLMGYPMEELLGKSDFDFFPAHEAEVFLAKDEQVFDSGRDTISEEEFTDRNGITHIILTKKTCYTDDAGQQYLVGTILDITQRTQTENLVRQRERELRTLVENLPTMVVRYDRQFRRVYVNQAYSLITGRSESEILGLSAVDAWRATNISAEAYLGILKDVMRSGKKTEVSLEWIDADSRLISHAMKIVPEFDIDGQINSVLALGFDLSDRRHRQIIEGQRQRVFEMMAHGERLDAILGQVALYVESSKIGGYCCILLLDEDGNYRQIVTTASFPKSYPPRRGSLPLLNESGHCHGWIESALRRERIILEDIRKHPCWTACQAFISEINAVACWSEPIFSSARQLLGVLTLYSNQLGTPDDDELALLLQSSHLSSIAIERKRIEQQMHHQASYDALTDLPNRRLFNNRLREEIVRAERGAYNLAVLFIDLDHFKEVNDTLGHEFGDLLLVEAAQRIRACVRESDTVARLGGDEFVIALAEVGEIIPQSRVAQNIVDALVKPFQLDGHHAYVSASIGIASYPQDADNAETLIGCADQAMYAAKNIGRNSFSFFSPGMREQARQRLQLAADLRGALNLAQLEVYCQPIIEIGSGRLVKAEALLRWRHPQRGMVPPDQFIPIAEETDLIHEIGAWVFREAADIAQRWNALYPRDGLRQVSVNVSPRQFVRGNPDAYCIDYLQAIGLNPGAMVIEITEGLLLDDQAGVMDKLRRFHELGIQLALDDFGTGYSAMAYLKKFNIDYLKIDRSFVRDLETDPGDRAIAEAIVAMAHRLGLKVIAEGVETEGQRDLLAAVGCEYVQGYLYAKPIPAEAFLEYTAKHTAALDAG